VFAAVDRVAEEAVATRAHGACVLHPAVGVVTTRRRRAEIRTKVAGTSEAAASAGFDAGNKRIASESFGASAYGDVVTHVTLGVDAAGGRARTDATVVLAHLVRWAINIFDAFGTSAAGVRIAFESTTAGTDGAAAAD